MGKSHRSTGENGWLANLDRILLSLGGTNAVHRPGAARLAAALLACGKSITLPAKRLGGKRTRGPTAAAEIWGQATDKVRLVKGYALFEGIWREHLWAMDEEGIFETNEVAEKYFGYTLDDQEVLGVWFNTYFAKRYPGPKSLLDWTGLPAEAEPGKVTSRAKPESSNAEMDEEKRFKARRFGYLLGFLCLSRFKTRPELAKKTGLDINILALLENGLICPTAEMKHKLDQAFGFPLHFEDHKQVTVRVGNQKAEIDEDIAPLIEEMWKAGIETSMSCQQGWTGMIWIEFYCQEDLGLFLNLVAEYEAGPETLYNRITNRLESGGWIPAWEYDIHVHDFALNEEENEEAESYEPPPAFDVFFSVRFPREDLATVFNRLRRHNRTYPDSIGACLKLSR